ncbi:DNA/RNA polymerase [Dacryopinax primogenitus]|uniref:DNA polymerase eta n=1 Tax=Dacryopinax primogenitus (strain DJM 731) TaxID=1858805 RepID=M5GDQ9_DACPD|nr:DNA/RNA polymerase [Dacryopinax primogenitus]EJU04732.1 DNA/RNA polymerase [Dacryopinax primogenitus]
MFASSSTAVDAEQSGSKITYRHLLSPQTLNVYNPLRVIALIDSDAFYAACEQVRLGLNPEKPIAVQQWQGLIAINYPARKYGITRLMSVTEATKKCPELICVHVMTYREGSREPGYFPNAKPSTHKVSLDHYRRESIKVLRVFQSTLPEAEIERASIDEAFFDLTAPVREEILRRYPYLRDVPSDATDGMDSPLPPAPVIDWTGRGNVLAIREGEEAGVDGQGTWADVALALGAEMVHKVRQEVHKQLGYTTSAGIARNKTMAKLCASCKKPFGQTVLRDAAIPLYLNPMPFKKIRFLGGKLGDALASAYDAKTIGDLLSVSKEDMQQQFGEESYWVYDILRGRDYAEVKERTGVKSMMASKNVRPAIKTFSDGQHWLRVLSAELSLRLEEARDLSPAVWPKTLVLHIKQGFDAPRSRQCPFPFTNALSDEYIARLGERLLRELVGQGELMLKDIINISLGFAGLEKGEEGQKSIEGFFGGAGPAAKKRRTSERGTPMPEASRPPTPSRSSSAPTSGPTLSHKCTRCSRVLTAFAPGVAEQSTQLEALKAEHEDYHFALDLQAADGNLPEVQEVRAPVGREKKGKPKAGKRKELDGIAAYFQKR